MIFPNCVYGNVKKEMKCTLAIHWIPALIILLVVAIVGSMAVGALLGNFSSDKPTESNMKSTSQDASTPASVSKTENTVYKMNEPFTIGDFKYTINRVDNMDYVGSQYNLHKADGTFAIISITVENTGKTASSISSGDFKIIDSQGREYTSDMKAIIDYGVMMYQDNIFTKELQPGIATDGYVIFDVPPGDTGNLQVSGGFMGSDTRVVSLGTV